MRNLWVNLNGSLIFLFFTAFLFNQALPLSAQTAAPIKLEILEDPDLGRNIYKVNVSCSKGQILTGKLNLMYYVGNLPGEIFNQIDMPYSFHLSLNGVYPGTYQIKVAIEDESDRIIESNAVTVVTK